MVAKLLFDITDEHYQAVGKVATHWAYVEMVVDALIARLSGVGENLHKVITVGQNMSFRIEVLAALSAAIADTSDRGFLESQIAECRRLMAERNFVVHAVWLNGGQKGFGYLVKKNAAGARAEDWQPQEIESIASEITTLAANLTSLLASLPLSHKDPEPPPRNRPRSFPAGDYAERPPPPEPSQV